MRESKEKENETQTRESRRVASEFAKPRAKSPEAASTAAAGERGKLARLAIYTPRRYVDSIN